MRHCEMVQKAAQGDTFYATAEQQACKGGAGAIGLMEPPEKVKSGEMYYSLAVSYTHLDVYIGPHGTLTTCTSTVFQYPY